MRIHIVACGHIQQYEEDAHSHVVVNVVVKTVVNMVVRSQALAILDL
jgi:hypothetical protein